MASTPSQGNGKNMVGLQRQRLANGKPAIIPSAARNLRFLAALGETKSVARSISVFASDRTSLYRSVVSSPTVVSAFSPACLKQAGYVHH